MVTVGARSRAQRSATSLHTVHDEEEEEDDAKPAIPPRRVASAARLRGDTPPTTSASDSSVSSTLSHACTASSTQRQPVSYPHPHPHQQQQAVLDGGFQRLSEVKRDSGIAPSVLTTDTPAASSTLLPVAGAAARPAVLPTIIIVQDEEVSPAPALTDRSPSNAAKTITTQPPALPPKKERPRGTSKSSSQPPPTIRRMMSSDGLGTADALATASPTVAVAVDDINLHDLTSDKVTFSTRGSLLFSGKRMQELIAAKGTELDKQAVGTNGSLPNANESSQEILDTPMEKPAPAGESPRQGLVAGRRTPSAQMLQAVVHGGRVLSTEEATFSTRVRSMYDHGDGRAANWTARSDAPLSQKSTPDLAGRSTTTPDTANGDLSVRRTRPSRQSSINADPRSSFYEKEPHEVAGGVEDWEDIDSRQVDRYGFIHQNRPDSRLSEVSSSAPLPRTGMQRVATSLRVETEQPRRDRKLKRGSFSVRSSRSVPPGSSSDSLNRGAASVHSTHSTLSTSRPNLFRSRHQRALDEASDMLTSPPGLTNIDEDEDAGVTASALKQRERSREMKWQKMARPVKLRVAAGKGGGMRFDFDSSDPKLVERTWKGIPDRWRATAWHSFLTTSAKKRNSLTTDEELIGQFYKLQGINSADDYQIDVDVPRTINMHVMFRRRYRGGQRLLFRVLHAVSLYFPDTGYVQGMAALAVTLLCYYEEELAFVMMVRLWQLRGLDQLFQNGFGGLMACFQEFEADWLRGGPVAVQLKDLGIDPTAWGTRWYLTLFNMSVPFPAQLRIWDVFMLLGDGPTGGDAGAFGGADLDVLHAVSAALIDATREILLGSDFENAMKVLTSFMPIQDEDLLMKVAKSEYKLKKKRKRDGVKA